MPGRPLTAVLAAALVAAACTSEGGDGVALPTTTGGATTSIASTTTEPTSPPTTESLLEPERRTTDPRLVVDACLSDVEAPVGLQTSVLVSGGVDYTFQWTVPSGYEGQALPVVLDFHDIGNTGADQGRLSGLAALAETEVFLAVQPTAPTTANDPRSAWELAVFDEPGRDDVAFVLDLLDHLGGKTCLDQDRIYATGMGNGGFFVSTLVCEIGSRLAAAVSVAGVTEPDACDPNRTVPYLAFHGTADEIVPIQGGTAVSGEGDAELERFFEQPIPDAFASLASLAGCLDSVDEQITESVTLRAFGGCPDSATVGLYTVSGGGHTWPGSAESELMPHLGPTDSSIDATRIALEFLFANALASAGE
ncbi:MAG: alpha/beta hydrolase family esterase [Acidimicrobiales bacterium]